MLKIIEDNNIMRTILHVSKGNVPSEQFRKTTQSRGLIRPIFCIWRRITTLSFLLAEYLLGKDQLNNVFINEKLPISLVSSFTSCIQPF